MSYRGEQKIKGKTYVYEAIASWDKDKKRSEQKRVYIGTKDETSGEFIPNKKYCELYGGKPEPDNNVTLPSIIKTVDYGDIYLMEQIANEAGLTNVLEKVFPTTYREILTCAFYLVTAKGALSLCNQWSESASVPKGLKLASQRISELLRSIDENSRMNFYRQWVSMRQDKEYLAFDISSVSSYSELIEYVEYGYNRDKEDLPQINIAMLFGEETKLPVFCRIYPGSIKDVSTLTGMVSFMDILKINRMHFVMDKGFYSEKGINALLTKRTKFSIGVPFSTSMAKEAALECIADIRNPSNAIEVNGQLIYAKTSLINMHDRRAYIHVYFDEKKQTAMRTNFIQKLLNLEEGLKKGHVKPNDKTVQKYLTLRNSKNGLNIRRNQQTIEAETALYGFFVILSNDSKDAKYILNVYRTKDVVEKSFDNLKNDLDLDRLNIHSDAAMEGRVFIGFIALILTSRIRNVMQQCALYKSFTFSSLLTELKKLKCVHFSGGKSMFTELTKSQKAIYKAFQMDVPSISSI